MHEAYSSTANARLDECTLAHATQAGRQARAMGQSTAEVLKTIETMGVAIMGITKWDNSPVSLFAYFLSFGLPV